MERHIPRCLAAGPSFLTLVCRLRLSIPVILELTSERNITIFTQLGTDQCQSKMSSPGVKGHMEAPQMSGFLIRHHMVKSCLAQCLR